MTDLNLRSDDDELSSILRRIRNLAWRRWSHDKTQPMAHHFLTLLTELDELGETMSAEIDAAEEAAGPLHVH